MTDLTSKLEVLVQARGKEKLSEATRKHIRRKIEAEFGSILLIFPDDKGKLIVVPDNLSVEDIVKMNLAMKKELDILKHHSSDIDKIIDQSSTYIRKSILDMKWKSPGPIHPSDVDIQSFPVPQSLKRLLIVSRKADQIQKQCSLFSVANTAIKGDLETIASAPNKGLLIQEGMCLQLMSVIHHNES